MPNQIEIIGLGSKGDGVAADGRFVPLTLPGEIVEIGDESEVQIITPSSHRIDAACRHFGKCGGCALQHLEQDEYLQWKRQQVVDAFAGAGLNPKIDDCLPVDAASRRRTAISATTTPAGTLLGFQERRSHAIVDIKECPVLLPAISSRLGDFRRLATLLNPKSETLRISILACENGLDVALEIANPLGAGQRKFLTKWTIDNKIARLSCNGEIILQTNRPFLTIAETTVFPPPGNFAQAVHSAEQHMVKLVVGQLKNCRNVIDLFAGFGTFALHLAQKRKTHAVEFEQAALLALVEAASGIAGIKPLTIEQRDLYRRPVQKQDLDKYDGAVFDPPRAGAEAQARELAASTVGKIVAVSCNPATLARDVKILVDGGYKIRRVTPIDQFLYSAHVEVVVLLERKTVKVKRPIFG